MCNRVLKILVLSFAMCTSLQSFAIQQGGGAPPQPEPEGAPPPPGIMPIDNHIWLFVGVGVLLGVFYLSKKRKAF